MTDPVPGLERFFHTDLGPARKWALLVVCVVLTGLVGTVRVATEARHAFSLMLLLPAIAASWYVGLYWGLSVAILAVLSWLSADLFVSNEPAPYWIH